MEVDSEETIIENCSSCGEAMDVSSLPPFANVQCPSCNAQIHVKRRLGAYEITRRQGTGGMSLVFAATDTTLGRQVAIKLLNEDYSRDQKRIEEFEKEARITAAISHPNVVRVYTVGQAYQRYYIAMELVEGDSLEQRMHDQGRLGEKFLVQLAIEVVEGLKAAHEAGLIHRDMKPGNVLIDSKGRAKIVDFGLALVTSGGKAIAEEIWATPYYVPPETLKMEEEDLRSDIYALGASLYHAISGAPPFTTETRSTTELLKIKTDIPKLHKVANGVSRYFCDVLDKAMAFNPEDRFQSYEEFLQSLKQIELYHRTGNAPEVVSEATSRRVELSGKKKQPQFLVLGLVLLAIVGGALWYFNQPKPSSIEQVPDAPELVGDSETADSQRAVVAAELRNAQNLLYASKYENSYNAYLQLALNKNLESETVYWTGLRSVISALLNGNSSDARRASREVLSRMRKSGDQMSAIDEKLQKALRRLSELETITPEQIQVSDDSLDVMILVASALKEWEQGKWDEAMNLIELIDKIPTTEDKVALEFFQNVVTDYRADYVLTQVFRNGLYLSTREDVKVWQKEVNFVSDRIKTNGRAKYNLEQWKRQLAARITEIEASEAQSIKEKEEAKIAAANLWNIKKNAAKSALDLNHFIAAARALESCKGITEEDEKWRQDMLYMCKAAEELYTDTFKALEKRSVEFTLRRLDGMVEYEKLLGATSQGLLVEDERKNKVTLLWRDLSPYTMLEIHKKISMSELSDDAKFRRKECIVCYCWLTGLDAKAEAGAERLSEENPQFAQKWSELMKTLN